MKNEKEKIKRGRPAKLVMPPPIPDTAENIAKAIVTNPHKKRDEWRFLKELDSK